MTKAAGLDVPRRLKIITPQGQRTRGVSFAEQLRDAWHDAEVGWFLATKALKRDVFGLSFGSFWLVLDPLLFAGTYYVLLKYIFSVQGAGVSFATFFTAATFWRSHSAMLVGSASLIPEAVRFAGSDVSLRVAYFEFLLSEFFNFLPRFGVLFLFLAIAGYQITGGHLYLAYLAVAQFAFSMAVSLWVSCAGGMFRDTQRLIGHAVWLWWYLSPGLYTINNIPDQLRPLYELNPFAHIMPALIASATEGEVTRVTAVTTILVGSLLVMAPGGWLAGRLKHRIFYRV